MRSARSPILGNPDCLLQWLHHVGISKAMGMMSKIKTKIFGKNVKDIELENLNSIETIFLLFTNIHLCPNVARCLKDSFIFGD